jgi:hypothetical protein
MTDQELFLGYNKAYNAKDFDGMLTCFADDCVFENISLGKVTVRTEGKAELEALARKSADAFSSREQKVLTVNPSIVPLVHSVYHWCGVGDLRRRSHNTTAHALAFWSHTQFTGLRA